MRKIIVYISLLILVFGSGFMVYKINQPDVLLPIGHLETTVYYDTVAIKNNHLYIVDRTEIAIIDVSNRSKPKLSGNIPIGFEVTRIAIQDNILYIARNNSLQTMDIQNPKDPVRLDQVRGDYGPFRKILVHNNILYAWEKKSNRWLIFDVTIPTNIQQLAQTDSGFGKMMSIQNENIYAYREEEKTYQTIRQIINVANPSKPVIIHEEPSSRSFDSAVASVTTNHYWIEGFLGDSNAFVIYDNHGVSLYQHPERLQVKDIAIDNDYLYIADLFKGLLVFDISDLTDVDLVATWKLHDGIPQTNNVIVSNGYIYLIDELNGVFIFESLSQE